MRALDPSYEGMIDQQHPLSQPGLKGAIALFCLVLLTTNCSSRHAPGDRAGPPPASALGATGAERPSGPTESPAETPSGGDWRKPGITEAERLADSDACYSLARARVANDIRIDGDIDAARGQVNSTLFPDQGVARRVDGYYYKNERHAWFENCMGAKGYTRG